MKYLVVKSLLGFGDRLESLKMCVKYAQDNNLAIFVDWSDSIWSRGSESFYKYFSLDMPTFKIEDVKDLSVHPPFWQGKLEETLTAETFNNLDATIGWLKGTYPADVIVATCNGIRSIFPDSSFFTSKFKIIDQRVIQEVKRRQEVYKLSEKWGIHLRGGDRASDLDYKTHRISQLGARLVASGIFNVKSVVVSDDEDYIRMWKQRWPDHPVLTSGGSQNHRAENTKLSKDQLNVNLLVDFLTLASCSRVFTTAGDSRFAREAQKLHADIKRIL
jgi:hypothetical protein